MKKKPELSAHGKKALAALREAVREAVAEHRQAGVPIVVRTVKPSVRRQSVMLKDASAGYKTTKNRRKIDR